MAKFMVIINVDEEDLKDARAESISEEDAENESIEFAIEQEMGWVNQSGISVQSIERIVEA